MAVQLRTTTADDADLRLDRWFRRHFPQLTQGALQKMLRTGQVRVDGKRAETNTRLVAGQEIRIPPLPEGPAPEAAPRAVDEQDAKEMERMVLYRDRSVIVLDKPPGLPVQGGPGIRKHVDGMLDALWEEGEERPRLVHRLDRDTSGILVIARGATAASRLAGAFRSRETTKIYWAVTVGRPTPHEGRLDLPLRRQTSSAGEKTVATDKRDPEGAFAITDFRTLDAAQKRAAWLELRPVTGRTHQLRVHCMELGCPILGDGKYGGAAAHIEGLSGQLHLHARSLLIPHPEGGKLEVEAPLPPHLHDTFGFLGFDRPKTHKPRRLP